jgi:hypothetical protein
MKVIVVIFLLSTSGIEKIELKINTTWLKINVDRYLILCGDIAEQWREINTTYYESRNEDPNSPKEQQGNYTRDGKLMIGYLCQ